MNAIRVIHPYWWEGSLVFDDEDVGLRREPFVAGADVVLGLLASKIDGCVSGFCLRFSDQPFPGYQSVMEWVRPEFDGNWYTCDVDGTKFEGWLCPALGKYFDKAPARIYLEISRSKKSLADVWGISRAAKEDYS